MADDNDLITEISWIIAIGFDSIHIHLALGYNAEESFPWIKNFVYEATKKQESLLYYIRYEPADETRKSLLAADPKYKYINKIIAFNLREDHFDPIVAFDLSENEKAKIIRALLEAAQDAYANYLKESITDETKLKYLLTNRHQLLYLSIGGVLSEFRDQGLYK